MATYYWVGGAGTWDATTTTNWATSSGGAGGAGVPTSADNAVFDSASNATAYAVTVGTNAVALDITIAGPAAGSVTMTFGATAVANCYGSWTNAATGVAFNTTAGALINFVAATTGKTVTTNNVTLGNISCVFNNVNGGWALTTAFTNAIGNSFNLLAGTLNINGQTCTINNIVTSGTAVRTLLLGSANITCSGTTPINFSSITNFTFDAGTSTITCNGTAPGVNPSGLSLYNLRFTNTAGIAVTLTNVPVANDIVFTPRTASGVRFATISVNLACNSIDWGSPANETVRVGFASSLRSASRTLTIASPLAVTNVDFRDIDYASGTMTGISLGNAGNNSNITFTAAKTVYWNLAAGSTWPSTVWATSSGGTPALANFPLAQDTAIIENTGLTAGNTITINSSFYLPTIDMSTRTANMTLATGATSPIVCGNFTCQSSGTLTITGTGTLGLGGPLTTQTITSNGVTFTQVINLLGGAGNSIVLGSALTSSALIVLTSGTLNMSNYSVTGAIFSSSTTLTRAIVFGTGNIVVTGNAATVWNIDNATNFTYTGTGRIEFSYSGATGTRNIFNGITAGTEANSPNFYITAGTDAVIFNGANRKYGTVDFTGFAGTGTIGNTMTIYGSLVLASGMTLTAQTSPLIFGSTFGIKTITSNGKTLDMPVTFNGIGGTWVCQDALTLGSTRALTMTNGMLQLKSGTTSTVGSFVTSGTNIKYLQSTVAGSQATISDASGINTVTYLYIRDINAIGGATWDATASTNFNVGNNTGWLFGSNGLGFVGKVPAFGFGFRI